MDFKRTIVKSRGCRSCNTFFSSAAGVRFKFASCLRNILGFFDKSAFILAHCTGEDHVNGYFAMQISAADRAAHLRFRFASRPSALT